MFQRCTPHPPRSTHSYARVDLLTHFELCELGPSGEYVPVPVNHQDAGGGVGQSGGGGGGTFMIQQGLQRRIRITLSYEQGSEIHWTKVSELVIGETHT